MVTALFAFVAVAFTMAIITVVVVSVCSRLEDAQWTLGGPTPGPMRALTRRIVGFHAADIRWYTPGVDWRTPGAGAEDILPGIEPQSAEPEWPLSTPM